MNDRRAFLGVCVSALGALAGCGSAPPPSAKGPPAAKLPALKHPDALADLCAAAGLRWLVETRPRDIASTAFLIPAIGTLSGRGRQVALVTGGHKPAKCGFSLLRGGFAHGRPQN